MKNCKNQEKSELLANTDLELCQKDVKIAFLKKKPKWTSLKDMWSKGKICSQRKRKLSML